MKKADIQKKLAKSAMELFHKQGYNLVSVDEIAKHSKMTRTSFYHYFKSKEDLFVYFAELERDRFLETLKAVETSYENQPALYLRKLLIDKMTLMYFSDCYKIAAENDLFNKIERIGQLKEDFDQAVLKMCAKIIEEGVRLGYFLPLKEMFAFLQFYQQLQKGIEPTFISGVNDDSVLYRYSQVVDLSIKAISVNHLDSVINLDDYLS